MQVEGLARLRVIDFSGLDGSRCIAGHYASKMLVDAGAEVIKIEPPAGDPFRHWSSSGADVSQQDSAFFRYLNAGKKSVVGNITDAHVLALIETADLVIETLSPNSPELAQFDGLDLCARWPHLVVLSISPYGRSGTLRQQSRH